MDAAGEQQEAERLVPHCIFEVLTRCAGKGTKKKKKKEI